MKYYGTYSCGHEGYVNLTGPHSQREWRLKNAFSGLCPECQNLEWMRKNEEAAEKSKKMELPELSGSPKQVAWANSIRMEFLEKIRVLLESIKSHKDDHRDCESFITEDLVYSSQEWLLGNKIDASYWIDTRHSDALDFIKYAREEMKKDDIPKEVKQEVEEEYVKLIVKPESFEKGGIVTIKVNGGKIEALYEKDNDFRNIMKSLGYSWDSGWKKSITEFTLPLNDRIAELGNRLLLNGFTVKFPNQESMEMAISGEYDPECTKWIKSMEDDTERLKIKWRVQSNALYNAARKIPGSQYSQGSVTVPVSHYREIEDFAEAMGFRFSQKALDKIEAFKEAELKFRRATPKISKAAEDPDVLKMQLEKMGVIEDLKDEP